MSKSQIDLRESEVPQMEDETISATGNPTAVRGRKEKPVRKARKWVGIGFAVLAVFAVAFLSRDWQRRGSGGC